MENWEWSQTRSVDELTEYMAYALRVLRNVDLPCEGITTPGGFAYRNKHNLGLATIEAVREVFGAEIPHYFRDVVTDLAQSVAPQVVHATGLEGSDPRCAVSIIGCTGDWFGGWDGLTPGSIDRFISEDLESGRLVDVVESGEPAVMVCHWPGIYYNGDRLGFNIFKGIVGRLHHRFDHLIWMKLSEISRYWAARELTRIAATSTTVTFTAPFSAPSFTVAVDGPVSRPPGVSSRAGTAPLTEVGSELALVAGTWHRSGDGFVACFDLPAGSSELTF
jgi:hypothetical protein